MDYHNDNDEDQPMKPLTRREKIIYRLLLVWLAVWVLVLIVGIGWLIGQALIKWN